MQIAKILTGLPYWVVMVARRRVGSHVAIPVLAAIITALFAVSLLCSGAWVWVAIVFIWGAFGVCTDRRR